MSSSIYSIYKRVLVSNYGPLYHPNWDPTTDRKLGDYGTLLNGLFTRIGNVRDLAVVIVPSNPKVKAHQTFSSATGVTYTFDAGAGARAPATASGKAKLKVSFTGGQGVSINAYGIQQTHIQNYQAVVNSILTLYGSGKWDQRWVIVMELYQAQKCIMAISSEGSKDAEIEFEARNKMPFATATMANANLGLVCKSHRNIGYTLDTQRGKVTLGLGLGMVRTPLLRKPRFQPFENKGQWGSDGPQQ